MVRKKNKRHNQSTSSATSSSANETQSKNMIVSDTELRELLENQCNDPREKAYHCLMREVFNMKVFHEASIQAGHISKAEYLGNKIDDRIVDFIIQIGEGKKGWLSRESVATLHKATITERVVDLLNDTKNKGPEARGQIIIFYRYMWSCTPVLSKSRGWLRYHPGPRSYEDILQIFGADRGSDHGVKSIIIPFYDLQGISGQTVHFYLTYWD
ncbi:hypothetical protein GLOIN_2v1736298 [Rhizophagus clarus]|uniref:Uncharacterized protein n=1 Tax=Rhizophagus clarus TaxID=94130 RepID=A0A8H3QHR7_9GLOM|nr:hypothetical protein GLOIN_2v1736298 [Rhizophagus clarus]